jgi:hypothetical protein
MKNILPIIVLMGLAGIAQAQQETSVRLDGKIYPAIIDECGDTVIVASLDRVSVSAPRAFDTDEEYRQYMRYRRAAVKVYPYAVEAIKTYREVNAETEDMKRKRKQRKYIRQTQKDLKEDFADKLKKLTKTQGFVLTKMIERELDVPMHELIKEMRGGLTATYWSTVGWLWGYKLKDGYVEGDDRILDMVLDDFDISYELPTTQNPKTK